MSVRPSIQFVVGIYGVTKDDPRYEKPGRDLQNEPIPPLVENGIELMTGRPKDEIEGEIYPDSVFLSGNPSGGFRSLPVVAYILDSCPEDMSRALMVSFPHMADGGYTVLPTHRPGEWEQHARAVREGQDLIDSANAEDRWVEYFTPWYTDWYYKRAIHVLHHMGWKGVTRSMLRFMIVYYWS